MRNYLDKKNLKQEKPVFIRKIQIQGIEEIDFQRFINSTSMDRAKNEFLTETQ